MFRAVKWLRPKLWEAWRGQNNDSGITLINFFLIFANAAYLNRK